MKTDREGSPDYTVAKFSQYNVDLERSKYIRAKKLKKKKKTT